MLHKTRGIVLHHIKYADTSLIVKIYTEAFGLQAYLVKGVRSKKGSFRSSFFQALTLLDLVVYKREKNDLQHLREAEVSEPFHSISTDVRKSTMALFLAEVIMKSMREGETNSDMFSFIASSLSFFNMQDEGIENFHIFLLLKLSRYLGFNPQGETEGNSFFDMREGKYYSHKPTHPDYLSPEISRTLHSLDQCGIGQLGKLRLTADMRSNLLDAVLIYYQIHLSGLGTIKSVEVLKTVFH